MTPYLKQVVEVSSGLRGQQLRVERGIIFNDSVPYVHFRPKIEIEYRSDEKYERFLPG